MSFDLDPRDVTQRILCYHTPTKEYFVVNSLAELEYLKNEEPYGVENVTGHIFHEDNFRQLTKREERE